MVGASGRSIDDLSTLRHETEGQADSLLGRIKDLAGVESPSDDAAGVNRAADLVAAWAEELGGEVRRFGDLRAGDRVFGDVLEARFDPEGASQGRPVLLLGHLDTVWGRGTLADMPVIEKDGRLFGPGVYDMKAGVVMALTALQSVRRAGRLRRPVRLLLVSDEEVGSPVSRGITEGIARQCASVLVLEPAQGIEGAYKTARKGVGEYRLTVRGVSAHSGVDFEAGHSAVLELARQVERIAGFTDLGRGLTLNPGVIGGGTRSNVIAAEAWVDIDVRIARKADGESIDQKLRDLAPFDPACSLRLTGGINRPPMERTTGTVELFRQAETYARALGFELTEAATGGGSDGNFTSALGVPTLDGMGAVGQGAHARDESIRIEALVPRTTLLAAMIARTESR